MSNKILIISFCALIAGPVAAIAQKLVKTDTSHYTTLRIDPANASGATVAEVFDDVKYIPLETTPQSLFGSIKQLEVTEDCFIILDKSTNCILIFKKDGKFRAKIKGSADDARFPIRNLAVNKWTKQIVYSGDAGNSFTYCNFDGKKIKTVNYPDATQSEVYPNQFFFIAADKMINYAGFDDADSIKLNYKPFSRSLLQYTENIRTVYAMGITYTPAQGKTLDIASNQFTYQGRDTTFLLSKVQPYSIYTVTPHTIKLSYKFIFPLLSSMPDNFVQNRNDPFATLNYFQAHDKEVFALENCYKLGNNLLFQASTWGKYKEDDLILNLKSGALIAYQHISPDEQSYFLPLYDEKGRTTGTRGFSYCDGKNVYVGISSLGMFTANNDNKDKHIKYNTVLANYFTKGNIKNNPVILQLKLKDKL
jgi:hypothetical protein